jgi:hypothetical protein
MGGDIRLRFDQAPVRFGDYILESLQSSEPAKDSCAFCNAPLQNYFRVGSQQVCPACTQKFTEEMRANLARNYRRAFGIGIVVAIVGAAIHHLLVAGADVSFGSILIGILVGMAMRAASRESAGVRYRVTAAALTLVAGLLPFAVRWSGDMFMPALYLAVGIFAAWALAARDVRTEIQGPFGALAQRKGN